MSKEVGVKMRSLTKQEMNDVTGAMAGSAFVEDGFGWFVTDYSVFEFDSYKYYASYVTDERGNRVFSGHSGCFENSVGNTCFVAPSIIGGNAYVYIYDLM